MKTKILVILMIIGTALNAQSKSEIINDIDKYAYHSSKTATFSGSKDDLKKHIDQFLKNQGYQFSTQNEYSISYTKTKNFKSNKLISNKPVETYNQPQVASDIGAYGQEQYNINRDHREYAESKFTDTKKTTVKSTETVVVYMDHQKESFAIKTKVELNEPEVPTNFKDIELRKFLYNVYYDGEIEFPDEIMNKVEHYCKDKKGRVVTFKGEHYELHYTN